MKKLNKSQKIYCILTIAAFMGFMASFLQMLDKLARLADPQSHLLCNINSVFSCSKLLDVWQSSVFGFPNALMCIILFLIMLVAGFVGITAGSISKNMRLVLQGMAIFFIGFGFWYLWQSIFVIGAMCIYCVVCYAAVLFISHAWLRLNYKELPIGKKMLKIVEKSVNNNTDVLIWITIAIIIIIEMLIKFS